MHPTLREFIDQTRRDHGGRLRSPAELEAWRPSATDWADSAVLGGATIADILASRVTDADLDPQVVSAFHTQYPRLDNLTDTIREHVGDPEQLRGLVNGVKGKVFETRYVDALNDGGLPAGAHAELAASPTQPAWDLRIHGPGGDVDELLQLKATSSLAYVREALERHPDIDVVVPHELAQSAAAHADLADHVIDSGITLADVHAQVGDTIDDVAAAGGAVDAFPEVAILFIAGHAVVGLIRGRARGEVLRDAGKRVTKAFICAGAGWLAATLITPWAAPVAAIGARLVLARREAQADFAARLDEQRQRTQAITAHWQQHTMLVAGGR